MPMAVFNESLLVSRRIVRTEPDWKVCFHCNRTTIGAVHAGCLEADGSRARYACVQCKLRGFSCCIFCGESFSDQHCVWTSGAVKTIEAADHAVDVRRSEELPRTGRARLRL